MNFARDTLLCTLFEFGNLWTLEIRHLPPSNPKRNSIMYKWYKEELYRIVISTLIMTDRRNCGINLELCTSNKWSSQIYVYNKTTKKVFLNTLITPKKKNNIESFIQFLWNNAFNNIYCFNYKESLGTTPTPSGKFKLNTVQLSTMASPDHHVHPLSTSGNQNYSSDHHSYTCRSPIPSHKKDF